MADETIRYRAEVDTSALQAQLSFVRNQVGFDLQRAFQAPYDRASGMTGALNFVSSDIAAVRSFAPQMPMMPVGGVGAGAWRAAEQTGFFENMLMTRMPNAVPFVGGMSIMGPPRGVFAGEFNEALAEQNAQSKALFVTGALATAVVPGMLASLTTLGKIAGAPIAGALGSMGLGAEAAAFGASFLGPAAVFLGAAAVGGKAIEGARERMAVEGMLQGRTRFSREGRMSAVAEMADLAVNDIELDFADATQILSRGLQRGAFAGVSNVEDFKGRMKELMENVKLYAKAFSVTEAEAADMVTEMRAAGILTPGTQQAQAMAMQIRGIAQMTGRAPGEIIGSIGQTAEAFRAQGILPSVGAELATRNLEMATRLQQGASPGVARAFQLLGGAQGVSEQLSAGQLRALQGGFGQALIFSAIDPSTGQLDPERVQQVLGPNATMQNIMGGASARMAQMGARDPALLAQIQSRMPEMQEQLIGQLGTEGLTRLADVRARSFFGVTNPTGAQREIMLREMTGFGSDMMKIIEELHRKSGAILADIEKDTKASQAQIAHDEQERLHTFTGKFGDALERAGSALSSHVRTSIGVLGDWGTSLNKWASQFLPDTELPAPEETPPSEGSVKPVSVPKTSADARRKFLTDPTRGRHLAADSAAIAARSALGGLGMLSRNSPGGRWLDDVLPQPRVWTRMGGVDIDGVLVPDTSTDSQTGVLSLIAKSGGLLQENTRSEFAKNVSERLYNLVVSEGQQQGISPVLAQRLNAPDKGAMLERLLVEVLQAFGFMRGVMENHKDVMKNLAHWTSGGV